MIVLFIASIWAAVACWKSQRRRCAAFGLAPSLTCKHQTTGKWESKFALADLTRIPPTLRSKAKVQLRKVSGIPIGIIWRQKMRTRFFEGYLFGCRLLEPCVGNKNPKVNLLSVSSPTAVQPFPNMFGPKTSSSPCSLP